MFSYYDRLYTEEELFDLDVKATTFWNTLDDATKTVVCFLSLNSTVLY